MPQSCRLAALLPIVVFAAACGSDPSDGPGPGPTPTIAISLSPTAVAIVQGNSAPVVASIVRGGGFTGTVTITTIGAPTGVTAAVSNITTAGTTTTGTVTLTVASSVDPGTYNLTIRASGSGVSDASAPFQLVVTTPPSISLTTDPTSSTVIKGGSATTLVTITRRSFVGAVTFAVEGLPAGVTGSFSASPTTLNSSVLTVQVAATTTAGTYPLVIRGTGTGVTAATVPYELRVNDPASYTISAIDPDPKAIAKGGSSTITVTLARVNFTGPVALTLEGLPEGVTGTFSPASVTGNSTTLTLQVGAGVPTGDYNPAVRGTVVGFTDQVRPFRLSVTGAVQGTYTLSTTPATDAAVQQGGTTNLTVNLNRIGGFAGSVALSVSGAPPGLTATVNPTTTTGATASLALQASGAIAAGTISALTIRGTTPGLNDVTVGLTVTITAPSAGGNVTVNFANCAPGSRPIWVAYQDGTSGPWTRVVGSADSYSFNVTNTKAAVAYVYPTGSNATAVSFTYATRAELQLSNAGLCPTPPPTKSLTGTVSNLGPNQLAEISLGGGAGLVGPGQTAFTLGSVRSGTFDLIGYARGAAVVLSSDRLLLRRGVNTAALANGAPVGPILDFTGGESAIPQSGSITIANIAGGENITHGMFYQLGASCVPASLYAGMSAGAVSSFTAYGVPPGLQLPGETHGLSVTAATGLTAVRSTIDYLGALGTRSVTLPSAMPGFAPTVLAGPYKRLRFQYIQPADLNSSVFLSYADVGSQRVVSITTTVGGYLGGQAVDLSVPDLSGLPGWDSSWAPAAPTTVDWIAIAGGSTASNLCTPGSRVTTSTRLGTA